MGQVKINRGRDFNYKLRLRDKDGGIVKLTGYSKACLQKKLGDGSIFEFSDPVTPGVDEKQALAFSAVPDSGDFKLDYGSGNITVAIAFDDDATAVQDAINGLKIFSEVTVTGDFTSGFDITYAGNDGDRNQTLPAVVENTLQESTNDVTVTPSVVTEGRAPQGLSVDAEAGEITVLGSEAEADALAAGNDQTAVLLVRIGSEDLNIPPLENLYDVIENPLLVNS